MKVKDPNGNILSGLNRSVSGGISVSDKTSYNEYLRNKTQLDDIKYLKEKLSMMEKVLTKLLESSND